MRISDLLKYSPIYALLIAATFASGAQASSEATMTVAETGLAALLAPNVASADTLANAGTIEGASVETIDLDHSSMFTVDLAGDGLVNLAAGPAMGRQATAITAAQASAVLDNIVNLNGATDARGVAVMRSETVAYSTLMPAAGTPADQKR